MPWKDGYTISDERSLTDAEVRWPGEHRCCFSITVDLSVASGPEGITEADLANPKTQFGLREGFDRVNETLDRFGRIDILVISHSVRPGKPFLEMTQEEYDLNRYTGHTVSQAISDGSVENA